MISMKESSSSYKIYSNSDPISSWTFRWENKDKYVSDEEKLKEIVAPELFNIISRIFSCTEDFFQCTFVEYGLQNGLYPEGKESHERFVSRQEFEFTHQEMLIALNRLIRNKTVDGLDAYDITFLGKVNLSIYDSSSKIIQKWISPISAEYIDMDSYDKWLSDVLRLEVEYDIMSPKKMEFSIRVSTHCDIWYDTRYNDKIVDYNKEIALINRTKLLEFLNKLKNSFPNAIIEEEEGFVWRKKSPKISIVAKPSRWFSKAKGTP